MLVKLNKNKKNYQNGNKNVDKKAENHYHKYRSENKYQIKIDYI